MHIERYRNTLPNQVAPTPLREPTSKRIRFISKLLCRCANARGGKIAEDARLRQVFAALPLSLARRVREQHPIVVPHRTIIASGTTNDPAI